MESAAPEAVATLHQRGTAEPDEERGLTSSRRNSLDEFKRLEQEVKQNNISSGDEGDHDSISSHSRNSFPDGPPNSALPEKVTDNPFNSEQKSNGVRNGGTMYSLMGTASQKTQPKASHLAAAPPSNVLYDKQNEQEGQLTNDIAHNKKVESLRNSNKVGSESSYDTTEDDDVVVVNIKDNGDNFGGLKVQDPTDGGISPAQSPTSQSADYDNEGPQTTPRNGEYDGLGAHPTSRTYSYDEENAPSSPAMVGEEGESDQQGGNYEPTTPTITLQEHNDKHFERTDTGETPLMVNEKALEHPKHLEGLHKVDYHQEEHTSDDDASFRTESPVAGKGKSGKLNTSTAEAKEKAMKAAEKQSKEQCKCEGIKKDPKLKTKVCSIL
ncbi:hypothetical protein DdX_03688 [Ditylenchus destructor]|uniref:Uncharacterized protein n=1 Tax=Ditylenchus destructor TaxID=166010 RepID=A0AAD4NFG3_9BILA|nr:hypothetical protein DdX_03688 [Ditylenchus destructor]